MHSTTQESDKDSRLCQKFNQVTIYIHDNLKLQYIPTWKPTSDDIRKSAVYGGENTYM